MAWGRKCHLVVRSPRTRVGDKWEWTETEISELHFDATITRSRVWNDNEANITIYNMSADTSASVFRRGATVQVFAGYDDEGEGLMFQGNIITHDRRRNGVDTMDMLYAICLRGTSDSTFGATPVSMSYPGTTPIGRIYESVAQTLGLVLNGAENLADISVDNFVYAGTVSGLIDILDGVITKHGYSVLRDNAAMVVYKLNGGDSTYAVTRLSFDAGLLEIREATDYAGTAKEKAAEIEEKGGFVISPDGSEDVLKEIESVYTDSVKEYRASTIVMPKLKPNALVDVDTDEIKGQFVVDSMEISIGNLPDSDYNFALYLLEVAEPSEGRGIVTYTVDNKKKKG